MNAGRVGQAEKGAESEADDAVGFGQIVLGEWAKAYFDASISGWPCLLLKPLEAALQDSGAGCQGMWLPQSRYPRVGKYRR